MRVAVVVPVSPFESPKAVEESVKAIKSLDYDSFDVKIVYVVDANEECAKKLRELGVDVLYRSEPRGRRGGALNDAVKFLEDFSPEYVAVFDIDSRPERNFVVECVRALENCGSCYIASAKRYIINGVNLVSETVEAEYYLINFLLERAAWKQFNGLIGVLRYELLKEGLNEDAVTEDADFATRMHAKGYKAILVKTTRVYEEAPMSWRELYSQRKRWYYGGLQLWRYRKLLGGRVKISWILSLTLPYIIAVFLPLLILAPPLVLYHYRKLSKLKVVIGLTIHTILLQTAAIEAVLRYVLGKGVEWGKLRRGAEVLN
ncbi:MAG: glycosyltransferase family 2 protein [Archaeoglobaceae archaeon]